MFDPLFATVNGLLCLAAVAFAAHAKEGRSVAVAIAALIVVNFVLCGIERPPLGQFGLRAAFAELGLRITAKETWAFLDALVGVAAVAIGFRYWWAWAIWAIVIIQELTHALRIGKLISGGFYSDRLDNLLWAQLALFFLIGGRGVVDRLHRGLDRVGLHRRTFAPTSARSRPGK